MAAPRPRDIAAPQQTTAGGTIAEETPCQTSDNADGNGHHCSPTLISKCFQALPQNDADRSKSFYRKVFLFSLALIAVAAYVQAQMSPGGLSDGRSSSNNHSVANDEDAFDTNATMDKKKQRWRRARNLLQGIRTKLRLTKRNKNSGIGVITTTTKEVLGRMDELTRNELKVLLRTKDLVKDLEAEAKALPWGGHGNKYSCGVNCAWWGDELLASYLIIMKFPEDLKTFFPFTPCKANADCSTDFALRHTLEFRQKFQPWLVTRGMMTESEDGFLYARGTTHSRSSIVWYQPGLHDTIHEHSYKRLLVHILDRAVAESLSVSDGRIGRFYTFLDCKDFTLKKLPKFEEVKKLFRILQDHFPDRLSALYLFNLSTPAQIFLKMAGVVLSEDVKQKIIAVPNDAEKRYELLSGLMDPKQIPVRYGGQDDFVFSPSDYFGEPTASEDEVLAYKTTMPYHA